MERIVNNEYLAIIYSRNGFLGMLSGKRNSHVSDRLRRSFWIAIALLPLLWALAAFEIVDYLSDPGRSTEELL